MIRVKIIKDWDSPNLFRQTPNSLGIWNNVEFFTDENKECDYIIILNKLESNVKVKVLPENIWAVMQEPYIKGIHDWMIFQHNQFSRVYTHHIFNHQKRYHRSQPLLPWHINKTYDELVAMKVPDKTKLLSCISSNKGNFPGHILRVKFIEQLINSRFKIDLFGKGYHYVSDKWEALSAYKYSIVIENSSSKDYWTEKIADCYLSFTVPIYFGCTNLDEYFPENSFIKIDINNFQESLEIISNVITSDYWEKNIDSIITARERILNEYQFFPFISNEINGKSGIGLKKNITLKKFSNDTIDRILYKFYRKVLS